MDRDTLGRVVRPRVVDARSGHREEVLLQDAVERRIEAREFGALRIHGPPGSGRRTALEFARRHFAGRSEVVFERHLVARENVFLTTEPGDETTPSLEGRLELAPWRRDEWIEYLLINHHEACAGVMARLEGAETYLTLHGNALLWTTILDELARDASLRDDLAALRTALHRLFSSEPEQALARRLLLRSLAESQDTAGVLRNVVKRERRVAALLEVESVRLLLAAEGLVQSLSDPHFPEDLPHRLAPALLRLAGPLLREDPALQIRLGLLLESAAPEQHASIAALLHRCGPSALAECLRSMRARGASLPSLVAAMIPAFAAPGLDLAGILLLGADLKGSHLDGADLHGAVLTYCVLTRASLREANLAEVRANGVHLSNSDLCGGVLDNAHLAHAHLDGAGLQGASLRGALLEHADLSGAVLDSADLCGASLRGAELARASFAEADLSGANLDGVDLRAVRLATRKLTGASLIGCHMEGQELDAPDLSVADLSGALLTSTRFTAPQLAGARLAGAGLADVSWPDANLREADLTHASFHLGSSRSGMLAAAPVSWGTRTGFYTDEYREHGFRSPESIRKADLRRADLRGALLFGTDFYLVDLRGARYTLEQERHLRACRAIL